MHENYAHVVSVNHDNQVVGTSDSDNTCHLCHRSHEDFAHFVEINGTTHVINDPSDTSTHNHRHSHPNGQSHHHQHHHHQHHHRHHQRQRSHDNRHQNIIPQSYPGDEGRSLSDDDDLDLSGNDLIPPSYDLSPPSYDEAIHMPKPNSSTADCSEETDPLYQNIDHSRLNSS